MIKNKDLWAIIVGRDWDVKLVDGLDPEVNGQCLFPKRKIEIRDTLTRSEMAHVLLHELTHAFLYEVGMQQLELTGATTPLEFVAEFVAIHGLAIVDVFSNLIDAIYNEDEPQDVVEEETEMIRLFDVHYTVGGEQKVIQLEALSKFQAKKLFKAYVESVNPEIVDDYKIDQIVQVGGDENVGN